jgi:hypothetical protein
MENLSLASGHITPNAKVVVELVDDDGMSMVMIRWPVKPTPVSPRRYAEIASRAMRVLADASTESAARKARKHAVGEDEE